MQLYLVRHGIAIDREDPNCPPPESERFLTPEGIRKTKQVAKGLKVLGISPEAMLTSPYRRARETAEIFADTFGLSPDAIQETESLLFASPVELFLEISGLERESVMCFGHAPHLDEVIATALDCRAVMTSLKKAGVAYLEMDSFDPPQGWLQWILPPKVLTKLKPE